MGVAATRRAAVAPVLFALLGACSFDGPPAGAAYRCETDDMCPDGTVCLAGSCRSAGGSDGDGGTTSRDGAPVDAPAGTIIERACPGTLIDQDDFDILSSARWYSFVDGDGDMGTAGGMALAKLFEPSTRAGLISSASYPLPSTAFALRVPAPSPQADTYAAFEIVSQDEQTAFLTIFRSDDRIVAEETEVGMPGQIVDEHFYDSQQQQVWRIRCEDDGITWETSPDAIVWTTLATDVPDLELPDSARIRIVIETSDASETYEQGFDDMVVCALE